MPAYHPAELCSHSSGKSRARRERAEVLLFKILAQPPVQ
jgi:hypothetical protein